MYVSPVFGDELMQGSHSQHRNHDSTRDRARAGPTRHDEVEREHGEERRVAELVVSAPREEQPQRVLALHVQQTCNCNELPVSVFTEKTELRRAHCLPSLYSPATTVLPSALITFR